MRIQYSAKERYIRQVHSARFLAILFLVSALTLPAASNITIPRAAHSLTGTDNGIIPNSAIAIRLPDEEANKPHLMAASYYSTKGDLKAMLKLNNKGALPLDVQPTLFNLAGERFDPDPITVDATSYQIVDMAKLVLQAGPSFEEGSLNLFYTGHDLMLGAQVSLVHPQHSISFDEQLVEPAMMFSSSRLEGLWWVPSSKSEVQLVLSNTTGLPLSVSARVVGVVPDQVGRAALTLHPNETRLIDVQKDMIGSKGGTIFETGGISIEHSGPSGALMARGMAWDVSRGYSSVIEFTDPANAKTSELHGAGLRLGSLKDEGRKPTGEPLRPVFIARNIGKSPATLTGHISYTRNNGRHGGAEIPLVKLQPGEIKTLRTPVSIGSDIESAGLEFEYSGEPGTVIMSAQSVSKSGTHVFRIPLLDPAAQKSSSGGYPWITDETSRTIVYIKNVTDDTQEYVLELRHAEGGYTLGIERLEAGQTKTLDLRQLRDEQVKDENGEVIPLDVESGQIHWSVRGPEDLVLIGRSEQVDVARGLSSTYACQNCCGDSFAEGSCLPGTVVGVPGDTTQFTARERDQDCYGNLGNWFSISPSEWFSNSTTIATVNSSGLATGQNPGSTQIVARWTAYVRFLSGPPPLHCVVHSILPAASALCQVRPRVTSIDLTKGLRNVDDYSVTIKGTGFGAGASVSAAGTGLTFSEVVVGSSTTILAQLAVAENASAGNHKIIVTVNGQSSTDDVFFFVQIPTAVIQDSITNITTCDPNTCTIGGQPNKCGAFRTLTYQVVDQRNPAVPVEAEGMVTEFISLWSDQSEMVIDQQTDDINANGIFADLVGLTLTGSGCPSNGASADLRQKFRVRMEGIDYDLTTVRRIQMSKSSGQYTINVSTP